jgi:LPXTG-site transpeptidase (sortase) family protein
VELRKRLNSGIIFGGLYAVAFLAYIIYGLQPVEAAEAYDISGKLTISEIGLSTDVTSLEIKDGELKTPDTIVGSYSRAQNKTFLVGHSAAVFRHLDAVKYDDEIKYNNKTYKVTKIELVAKDEVSMNQLLNPSEEDTLVIMTCAGKKIGADDATHRLIITAASE